MRLLYLIPAIAWAGFIFYLSSTPNLTFTEGDADWLIRKSGHVAAYFLLYILVYFGLTASHRLPWNPRSVILASLITLLYAISDEWHQSTVDTRDGNILDVIIDSIGIIMAILVVAWLDWWYRVLDQPDTNPVASFNYMGASVQPKHLPQLAAKLAEILQGGEVIALSGDLGSGKTTFTQALAKELGVTKTVSSPTYTIEKQYPAAQGKTLYHHDWYRLDQAETLDYLDLEDKIGQTDAIIVIEWPDRAPQLLPKDTIRIEFSYVDEQTRKITLHR